MPDKFVDIETRAKQLGISVATLKARVFSREEFAFIFLDCAPAHADDVPANDANRFPDVEWEIDPEGILITGWVILADAQAVFLAGRQELAGMHVTPFDACLSSYSYFLTLSEDQPERDHLTPDDIYFRVEQETPPQHRELRSRERASLYRIVTAMRLLLRSEAGGNFPSDAKIIGLLEEHYGAAEGVSKTNLEKVFSDATKVAGDDMKPRVK